MEESSIAMTLIDTNLDLLRQCVGNIECLRYTTLRTNDELGTRIDRLIHNVVYTRDTQRTTMHYLSVSTHRAML